MTRRTEYNESQAAGRLRVCRSRPSGGRGTPASSRLRTPLPTSGRGPPWRRWITQSDRDPPRADRGQHRRQPDRRRARHTEPDRVRRAGERDHVRSSPTLSPTRCTGSTRPGRVVLWLGCRCRERRMVGSCWQCFLRRFDIEPTFRLFKQTLGWTKPRLRSSEAADWWTGIMIAAYAQLRLARPLATDLRRPWEKPAEPNKLTPARVRRGFRNLHAKTGSPAGAPKPS